MKNKKKGKKAKKGETINQPNAEETLYFLRDVLDGLRDFVKNYAGGKSQETTKRRPVSHARKQASQTAHRRNNIRLSEEYIGLVLDWLVTRWALVVGGVGGRWSVAWAR